VCSPSVDWVGALRTTISGIEYGYQQATWIKRVMRQSAVPRPVSWLYARTLHHIDRIVYRLTRGRETFTSWVAGLPVVMLTTTGAKSGRPRTLPVLGIPVDDRLVVIASNYGQRRNPAWYYNLQAHPRASVFAAGASRDMVARELTGDERERWYARGIAIYPGWRHYRKRAHPRQIPVVELRPAVPDDNPTEQ
jgi:deazaflavin-dependent oxidoreductase (nitroreductase family)